MKRFIFALAISSLLISGPAIAYEILFGITADGRLITIDVDTGEGTLFFDTGLGSWEALDAHPNGLLYAIVNEHRLATVDPNTGDIEVIGDFNGANCGEALAWVDGTLYGAGDFDFNCRAEALMSIDPATGSASGIGPFGGGYIDVDGFAYSTDGVLYATDMNIDPNYRALLTIDVATGWATPVSLIEERVIGLAFDFADNLYGVTIPDGLGGPSDLVRIDTTTGEVTNIGYTGFSNVSGLAFTTFTTPVEEQSWSVLKASYR